MSFVGYTHDKPYNAGFLPVGEIHKLHYEQYGKQDGKPAIFLHGGPGGSTSIASTVFFDPTVYRVHLVCDIEALREHLGIERWQMVFGGSWASTLALLYAQAHPEAVGSLVLRGIFTERKSEIEWTRSAAGAGVLFTEAHAEFVNHLSPAVRENLWPSYHKRLTSDDVDVRKSAARAWNKWELGISSLVPGEEVYDKLADDT